MSSGAKQKTLSKETRIKVFKKYNGHCAYCGCELKYGDMQVDHLIPKYWEELHDIDTDTFDNYMPSCRACNYYKGSSSLENFRKRLETMPERLEKKFLYRIAKKFNFIQENRHEVQFYFERYEVRNFQK